MYSVIEESQVPISIFIRLEESPSKDLTMAEAYARKPDLVYNVLLRAIYLAPLYSIDLTLL